MCLLIHGDTVRPEELHTAVALSAPDSSVNVGRDCLLRQRPDQATTIRRASIVLHMNP